MSSTNPPTPAPAASPSASVKRQGSVRPFFRKVKTEIHEFFHHHDQDTRHKHNRSVSSASSASIKTPADNAPLRQSIPSFPTEPIVKQISQPKDEKPVVGYDVHDEPETSTETDYFAREPPSSTVDAALEPAPKVTSEEPQHEAEQVASVDVKPESLPPALVVTPPPAPEKEELIVIPEAEDEPHSPSVRANQSPQTEENQASSDVPPLDTTPEKNADEPQSNLGSSTDNTGDGLPSNQHQTTESVRVPAPPEHAATGSGDTSLTRNEESQVQEPETEWEPAPELLDKKTDTPASGSQPETVPEPEPKPEIQADAPKNEEVVLEAGEEDSDGWETEDSNAGDDMEAEKRVFGAFYKDPNAEPTLKNEPLHQGEAFGTILNGQHAASPKSTLRLRGNRRDTFSSSTVADEDGEEFGSRSYPSGIYDDDDEEFGSRNRVSRLYSAPAPGQNKRLEDWLELSSGLPLKQSRTENGLAATRDSSKTNGSSLAPSNSNGRSVNGRAVPSGPPSIRGGLWDLIQMAVLFPFIATLCVYYSLHDVKDLLFAFLSRLRRRSLDSAR